MKRAQQDSGQQSAASDVVVSAGSIAITVGGGVLLLTGVVGTRGMPALRHTARFTWAYEASPHPVRLARHDSGWILLGVSLLTPKGTEDFLSTLAPTAGTVAAGYERFSSQIKKKRAEVVAALEKAGLKETLRV